LRFALDLRADIDLDKYGQWPHHIYRRQRVGEFVIKAIRSTEARPIAQPVRRGRPVPHFGHRVLSWSRRAEPSHGVIETGWSDTPGSADDRMVSSPSRAPTQNYCCQLARSMAGPFPGA
jgi:hypothetical protein